MAMQIFKYEKEVNGSILDQILSFIQPRFHDEVRRRYNEISKCIEGMLEQIEDLKSEEVTRKLRRENNNSRCFCYPLKKQGEDTWEKRIFLSGTTASFLLGRCDSYINIVLIVCYNGSIYKVTNECSEYPCEGIAGVCLCGRNCGFFQEDYLHPDRLCTHDRISCVEYKSDDDLDIFKNYTIFSEFIELTDRNNVQLFIRGCECDYLNTVKELGCPYPFSAETVEDILLGFEYCDDIMDILSEIEDVYDATPEYGHYQGLRFLKNICEECLYRDELVKCVFEIWRQKTYGPNSKIYFKAKENYEKLI